MAASPSAMGAPFVLRTFPPLAGETPRLHRPVHPHPRIKSGAGSSPLPSRERGFSALPVLGGFPPARE